MDPRWLALVALSLSGCVAPTDLTPAPTPAGTKFTFTNATSAQQELARALWVEQKLCMSYTGNPYELKIQVMPGAFLCGATWAAGCSHFGTRIQVSGETHVFENALGHEYIHTIDFLRDGKTDYEHTAPVWAKCDWRNR
jgi:hypothetical protein